MASGFSWAETSILESSEGPRSAGSAGQPRTLFALRAARSIAS